MRHVARDGAHEVADAPHSQLRRGSPVLPEALRFGQRFHGIRRRRQNTPAVVEQVEKPAYGPECSVPAIG